MARTKAPPLIAPDGSQLDWRTVITVSAIMRATGYSRPAVHNLLRSLSIAPTVCELGGTRARVAVITLEQASELTRAIASSRPERAARASVASRARSRKYA